jgi:two-component system, chemotaxis family, protein-glutamate methylesterase/glutaminase
MKKIKVLVIDDSAFIRQTLTAILNQDSGIEVIATAADPIFAANKISHQKPDVITLDLEMPRMNGLAFLKKLMSTFPIPVVIISSLTEKGGEMTLKALEYGAIEVITKPKLVTREFFDESRILLCDAIKAAAQANMGKILQGSLTLKASGSLTVMPKLSADQILELTKNSISIKNTTDKIIVLGASTGGTQAIEAFLKKMPPDCPGIVIVQHMPELFTKSFADRLNKICSISVKEGVQNEIITSGKAIIAPGNRHMLIKKTGAKYSVDINDGPLVNRHRPSVDVLFRSAANCAGPNALGIIMTGMGDDGARGLLEMHQAGSYTIAQDENSCVVFGMPKAAINLNAASAVLPLHEMPGHVIQRLRV